MAAENKKQLISMKKNRKIIAIAGVVSAVVIIGIIIACILMLGREKEDKTKNYEWNLGNGIYIESSEAYTGEFWEDGTDRDVENVWKLTVLNSSDKDIQLLKIHADAGDTQGEFEISTLTAGGRVEVLESSARSFPQEVQTVQYAEENLAFFETELSICQDMISLYAQDEWIKVENITDQDIDKDIFVYYKNEKDGVFQGGITYRARFPGGAAAGQSVEQQVSHYRSDISKIMYVAWE